MATVLTTAAIVLAVLLLFAVAVLWRLYNDGMRRADAAARLVAAERAKSDQQQLALRRYEVAFASISGRGELGEQVLLETARALGLREDLHFTLQTDLAGGGRRDRTWCCGWAAAARCRSTRRRAWPSGPRRWRPTTRTSG